LAFKLQKQQKQNPTFCKAKGSSAASSLMSSSAIYAELERITQNIKFERTSGSSSTDLNPHPTLKRTSGWARAQPELERQSKWQNQKRKEVLLLLLGLEVLEDHELN